MIQGLNGRGNRMLLRKIIFANGYTVATCAERLGLDYQTLRHRLNGRTDFTLDDMRRTIGLLKLTPTQVDEIFFDKQLGL